MAEGGQIDTDILSEEMFDVLCSMCKNQGNYAEGVKYCVDCKDYFCVSCVKVHSKVPLCACHKVLDKSQVDSKSGASKGLPRAPTERCERHRYKYIDMYCQIHDNVGCSTCMAVDHRLCKNTFYIPEFIQNNTYQVVATREIQTKLKVLDTTLAEQADIFKQDRQRLQKRKAEILADIRKFRQEINDHLDKLEKSSINEIEYKVKSLEDKIEDCLKHIQANKSRITSINDKLASSNTNQSDVFVYVKMAEDAANVANKDIDDAELQCTTEDIEYEPDRTIPTQLEEKKTLGTLAKKPTKTSVSLFKIKEKKTYNVKVESDKNNCLIRSSCCMEDGTIILADGNNNKLKRLHKYNYTVTDYCDLTETPFRICMINNTQVAVTMPSIDEVHFISIEGHMKSTNKINTDFKCYCLAYANNNLYISDSKTSVYMYTLTGRKLIHVQFSKDPLGYTLFSDIRSIAVSQDATRIYVADSYKGLIVMDNTGHVITSFKDEQLKFANCCYLSEAGSVLVSGNGSNNVLQFTSDGELIGEIIKFKDDRSKIEIFYALIKGIEKRRISSVCCNLEMTKMCTSKYADDNIEVYDI